MGRVLILGCVTQQQSTLWGLCSYLVVSHSRGAHYGACAHTWLCHTVTEHIMVQVYWQRYWCACLVVNYSDSFIYAVSFMSIVSVI